MDFDLIFVAGLAVLVFGVPMLVSAYADRRWPRNAVLMFVLGGGAVFYAMNENPDTYSVATIDVVIVDVIGRYLN